MVRKSGRAIPGSPFQAAESIGGAAGVWPFHRPFTSLHVPSLYPGPGDHLPTPATGEMLQVGICDVEDEAADDPELWQESAEGFL